MLHLTALWAFGVAQPIFSFLNGNPELLILRGTGRFEVLLLGCLIVFLPPVGVAAYLWLAGRLSAWVGDTLYLFAVGVFCVPVASQLAAIAELEGRVWLLSVVVVSAAGVILYANSHAARLFAGYSFVLPVAGLVWFVQGVPLLPATATVSASGQALDRPPIVMVVLDELPVSSLMTRGGRIDPTRYPNFARLARDSTWYVNATTVHDFTNAAVPAILTGSPAPSDSEPFLNDHPHNLFTLLGATYTFRVHEASTRLCPERLCPLRGTSFSEQIDELLAEVVVAYLTRVVPAPQAEALEVKQLERSSTRAAVETIVETRVMLSELSKGRRGRLYYTHLLLPHVPWRFLPSSKQYEYSFVEGLSRSGVWGREPWFAQQGYQRHLLQVGYVDRLLGRLVERLEQLDLYEDSLVIVVADHGTSFRPGVDRRYARSENFADVANVPLFIKYPHQERGRVDLRDARVVDIVPTIADVVGIAVPWVHEGRSLLGLTRDSSTLVVGRGRGGVARATLSEVQQGREETLERKAALFGEGDVPLYRIGKNLGVLGRVVSHTPIVSTEARVRIEQPEVLANVQRGDQFVPVRMWGTVEAGHVSRSTELAVAVNGRVQALTRCFVRDGRQQFRALVPEGVLREGFNRVDVFTIDESSRTLRLEWVGGNGAP